MPRGRPFASKGKRTHAHGERRERKKPGSGGDSDAASAEDGTDLTAALGAPVHGGPSAIAGSLTAAVSKAGAHNRWSTVLARESDDAVYARKIASADPWDASGRGRPCVYQPSRAPHDPVLDHPRGVSLAMGAQAVQGLMDMLKARQREAAAAANTRRRGGELGRSGARPVAHAHAHAEDRDASGSDDDEADDDVGVNTADLGCAATFSSSDVDWASLERAAFDAWLEALYARYPRERLNHFEHNMEVWAQLWHTLATADVVCIVADVRCPHWHLPLSLYRQVVNMRKPLVIILNKCDLVPAAHVAAWKEYIGREYAGERVHVVDFSSSGASLDGTTALAARRRFLREARKQYDAAHVSARAECVRRLLEACGAEPDAVGDVVANVMATRKDAIARRDAPSLALHEAHARVLSDSVEESSPAGEHATADDEGGGASASESASSSDVDDEELLRMLARPVGKALPHTVVHRHPDGGTHAAAPSARDTTASDIDAHQQLLLSEKAMRRRARKAKRAGKHGGAPAPAPVPEKPSRGQPGKPHVAAAPPAHRRRKLVIGMVGHPNAGKSSIINTICADKRVSVSRTAGHTKRAQNVPVVDGIELLDCPGLIFPHVLGAGDGVTPGSQKEADTERAMQELLGVIPIAQVREPFTAIRYLGEHFPLERMYGLTLPKDEDAWSPMVFAETLATKRGIFIAKIGRPDAHAVGREVLYDSQDGVIPLRWWPPGSAPAHGEVE